MAFISPSRGSRSSSADPVPLLESDALSDLNKIRPKTFEMIDPAEEKEKQYYTVDEAISKIGNGIFQYRLLFLTGFIWAADAMEMMLLSFVMPILKKEWNLVPPLDGAISSVVFAGMLCGTAFWSILSDKMGRRKVVIFSNLGCAIFGALSGLSVNIYCMLIARFFVGFSVGGSGTAYTLFAEYAPKEVRGSMLVIEQSFWSIGAIASTLLAWICLTHLSWRWYMCFSSIPLFAIALCSKWMPESIRWLLAAGKVSKAQKLLKYVANVNGSTLPKGMLKTEAMNGANMKKRGNPLDAFNKKYRKTSFFLYIAFFLCVFGYYGICFISVNFFGDLEAEHGNLYFDSLISASSELPALFVGVYLLDRIGRKQTLLISFGVFTISCFLLIFPFIQSSSALAVLCVFFARMNVSLGFMAIYIYFSEYYPTSIRSTALGMASAAGRIAGMITSIISEDVPFTIGILLFAISGGIAFLCIMFVGETMGRNMETSVAAMGDNAEKYLKQGFEMQKSEKCIVETNNYDELRANSSPNSSNTSVDLNKIN